jgi:predicted nucleic acid-binding protein
VIVLDTSVFSLVFRRKIKDSADSPTVAALRRMINEDWSMGIPGIVFQELLSGVKSQAQFRSLQADLQGIPILLAERRHHLRAAEIHNTCRRQGITCTTIDCLIAATTLLTNGRLFTLGGDFNQIAEYCELEIFALE